MSYIADEVRAYDNGSKYWYQNGKRHRVGGPAVEKANGDKWWYQNGKLHRTNGPAIEKANGTKYWHLEGEELTEYEFNTRTKPSCSGKVVEIDGKKYTLTEIV